MKFYNMYEPHNGNNFYFKKNPAKTMSVREMAKFLIRENLEYISDYFVWEFTQWYITRNDKNCETDTEYVKLECGPSAEYERVFLNWIENNFSMKRFLEMARINITTERLR